jgi:WD40 repeat protein
MTIKFRLISSIFIALVWLTTSSTYAQTPAEACPGFLPSRLVVGEIGRVLPDTPNRIREHPDIDSELIGEIPVGHTVFILAEPSCDASGMAWWQVEYQGVVGWTAEGQDQTYWLEPVSRITPATATRLTQKMRLGRGHLNTKVLWLKDGTIAVGGQFGIWLYDGEHLDAEPRLLGEDMGEVTYLAATNDGTERLISVTCSQRDINYTCIGNTVRFWSLETGHQLSAVTFDAAFGFILSANSDATMVASTTDGTTIQLWDLTTGKRSMTLPKQADTISALAFSPDGKVLASGTMNGEVRLWDVGTGTPHAVLSSQKYQITDIEFSPDGKTVATAIAIEKVYFWDVMTGTLIWSVPNNADVEDPYIVYGYMPSDGSTTAADLTFNTNGSLLAAANWAGTLTLWDAHTGQQLRVIDTKSYDNVTGIAFNPDGTQLATNHVDPDWHWDNSVKVWEITSEQQVANLQSGHIDGVSDVEFSSDGLSLVSSSGQYNFVRNYDYVRVWDIVSGDQHVLLGGQWMSMWDVEFSPDSKLIATAGEAGGGEGSRAAVWLWEADSGDEWGALYGQGTMDSLHTTVAFHPDGTQLAASLFHDDTIGLWDINAARERYDTSAKEAEQLSFINDDIYSYTERLLYSPNGLLLATANYDGVRLWDATTGDEIQVFPSQANTVRDIAFSPDGKLIAAANGIPSFSNDSLVDNALHIYDVSTYQEVKVIKHDSAVTSVAFTDDGLLLATSTFDGRLRLWEPDTYTLLSEISTSCGKINRLDFNADGTLLALACSDSTIRVMGIG